MNAALSDIPQPGAGLALYVHWPFCISKCPYCDFNSHVREQVDQAQWRDALMRDLQYEAQQTPGRKIQSIFFGGGTPSLMPPATVAALIDAADHHWGLDDQVEITLEANPSSVESNNFAALASAGVNRFSLGVQALDDETLVFLGRAHRVDEALAALAIAQRHVARTSIDLIYARPHQGIDDWAAELQRAFDFCTDHLSLYQLTIEPGTRFATMAAKGALVLPDADLSADMFDLTQQMTESAGIPAYEISNHARPGQESRHNLTYWRYQDYVGIGPGAHGRRGHHATERHRKPENYLAAVARHGHGIQIERPLPAPERAAEALMMGLRLREGIDLSRIHTETGIAPDHLVDARAITRLIDHGLLQQQGARLNVTPQGMIVLDAILPAIVTVG